MTRWAMLLVLITMAGCVPYPLYRNMQLELSASQAKRNEDTKNLAVCEERVKNLKGAVQDAKQKQGKPVTIIVPAEKINQAELEVIKKRALAETERKLRGRIAPSPTEGK